MSCDHTVLSDSAQVTSLTLNILPDDPFHLHIYKITEQLVRERVGMCIGCVCGRRDGVGEINSIVFSHTIYTWI